MGKRDGKSMVEENDPQFCRFWDAYPKRVAKKDARFAWAQLNPDALTVDRMLTALRWQTQQPGWLKDDGAFIPYPASWLRAERWDDEAPIPTPRVMSESAATVFRVLGVKP